MTSDYETEVDFGRSPSTIVAMSGADLSDDEGAQPHSSESPCLCARGDRVNDPERPDVDRE